MAGLIGAGLLSACTALPIGSQAVQDQPVDSVLAGAATADGLYLPAEIVELLPPDAIRAIDNPRFVSAAEAAPELGPDERILGLVIDGDARAYPLSILSSHEIVNDRVGGKDVAVTWCPLCYSALVFSRHVEGQMDPLTFGVSGKLLLNTLVMFDRETDSLWSQLYGQAVEGDLTGAQLDFFPATVIEWSTWRERFPQTQVLSKSETRLQFNRGTYAQAPRTSYAVDPYAGYYRSPYEGVVDYRIPRDESSLQPKKRVIGIRDGDLARAYPYALLRQHPVINDRLGQTDLLIWFDQESEAGYAYERRIGDRLLTFSAREGEHLALVDLETGSTWDPFLGRATDGRLEGEQLLPIFASSAFEFGWTGYFPDGDFFEWPAGLP